VQSLDPGASDRTVKAALNSAKGQARHAVIDARGSGLAEAKLTVASGDSAGHRTGTGLMPF
jgi:hypothetical protein